MKTTLLEGSIRHATISALLIVKFSYVLYFCVLESRFPVQVVFQDAEINYSNNAEFEIRKNVAKGRYGRFLLAGNTPPELG